MRTSTTCNNIILAGVSSDWPVVVSAWSKHLGLHLKVYMLSENVLKIVFLVYPVLVFCSALIVHVSIALMMKIQFRGKHYFVLCRS